MEYEALAKGGLLFEPHQGHTGYPETTNATDNIERSSNQQTGIGCK